MATSHLERRERLLSFLLVPSLELGWEKATEQIVMKLTHQLACEFLKQKEVY